MADLIKPVTPGLSRFTYLVDSVVCKKIHSPLLSSLVIGATLVFVAYKLYTTWSPYNYSDDSEFLPDFLQNVMNLLFIVRFPPKLCKPLRITSNKYVETLLFACLNVVAVASLCSPYPFSSFMSLAFRVLLWVLIICPYLILALNLAEYAWGSFVVSGTREEKGCFDDIKQNGLLALIVDANNSFLAIFIAQSFTAVNLNLQFCEHRFVPLIYKYATYSLKFYLIYCFVLYEVVVVIYDVRDIKSYAELYQPIQLGANKKTWRSVLDRLSRPLLTCTVVFAMCFDAVMMWVEYFYQHL